MPLSLAGLVSPVVELSISGMETDCVKVRTPEVESNGLNPVFTEENEFEFQITMPEIACLGITVYNMVRTALPPFPFFCQGWLF